MRNRFDIHGSAGSGKRIGVHRLPQDVDLLDERFDSGNVPLQIGFDGAQEAQCAVVTMADYEECRMHRRTLARRPLPPDACATDHDAAHADQERKPRCACNPDRYCKHDASENRRLVQSPPRRKRAIGQRWIVFQALHTVQ